MHANHPIHDRLPIVALKPCLHRASCSRSRYDCLRTLKFFAENGFIPSLSFCLSLSLFSFCPIFHQTRRILCGDPNATMEFLNVSRSDFPWIGLWVLFGFEFWPANRLRCFIVGTVLQIIANAASNCLTICSNKPSACHSFDDIFGRLT